MAWMMSNGRGLGVERLPGKKRKSINLYVTNEYVAYIQPLAYCLNDETATLVEEWLALLVKGKERR